LRSSPWIRRCLDVFHVQAAPTTGERAQQSPDGEIEEEEGNASILPARSPRAGDVDIGAVHAAIVMRPR
jgi:hypothetical protein